MSFVVIQGDKFEGFVLNRVCILGIFFVLNRVRILNPQPLTYTKILVEYSPGPKGEVPLSIMNSLNLLY